MRTFNSPYDIPREAEAHVQSLVAGVAQIALEVTRLSLLPAGFFVLVGVVCSVISQQDWMWLSQPEGIAVNGLAALSTGCVRTYLRQDCQQQEIELG